MPRPPGHRNRDYDASRHALARAVGPHLLDEAGNPATLQALAAAAGVSVPTIRHYFGDRDGVFRAALHAVRVDAVDHLTVLEGPAGDDGDPDADLDVEARVLGMVASVITVWRRYGLGDLIAAAMSLGLASTVRGPAFLDEILEPLLQSFEMGLRRLAERRALPPIDPRTIGLSLLGPVLLALLHQDGLGGHAVRPLDVAAYARMHTRTVLAGLRALDHTVTTTTR